MINKPNIAWLENNFKLDFLNDIVFKNDTDVSFVFDMNESTTIFRKLSGDLSKIALPDSEEIPANELFRFVEPDNLLAEVEGKHNFIDKIKKKFLNFSDVLFLYIPIKRENEPLWLYVGFKRLKNDITHIVFGQVIRVYDTTPVEIIHYQKTYQDSLTKLFTRETLKMHLEFVSDFERSFIMYCDIDNFKRINDQYGHQKGDEFLVDIANYFISKWEYNVLYYRLGGDEFFVYCYDHDENSIISRAKQIIHDIENLNDIAKSVGVSASIGIVKIDSQNKGYHSLLNLGDQTMYESKVKGPGNFTIYQKK